MSEDVSFRNRVLWYREELEKIIDGARASEFFNVRERRSLKRCGILKRDFALKRNLVTPRAQRVLKEAGYRGKKVIEEVWNDPTYNEKNPGACGVGRAKSG